MLPSHMFGCHSAPRRTRRASPPSTIPVASFPILHARRLPPSDRGVSAFSSSPCLCRCRASARPLLPSWTGRSLNPCSHVLPTNTFRIRTYEKSTRNPFRIRTSKTKDLKLFRMNIYEKRGGGAYHSTWDRQSCLSSFRRLRPAYVDSPASLQH